MKISDRGVLAIARHEGIALGPYRDSADVWTMAVGHTAAAGPPDPALQRRGDTRDWPPARMQPVLSEALGLLARDLERVVRRVNAAIRVPLAQHQFDALVSFDFNTGGITRARLVREINAGDLSGAGFMGWLRPKEIIPRRRAEQALFLTGDYAVGGGQVPVYDSLGDGRLHYRCSLGAEALLALMPGAGQGAGQGAGPATDPGQGGLAGLWRMLRGILA